jgi:hypothetical protein
MDPNYQSPQPRRATDERGQLLPITEEELKARAPMIREGLRAIGEIGTEEEQRETLEFLAEALGPNKLRLDR